MLGVCLGHQCIGEVFGGRVVRAPVMHGKTSSITHDGRGVFAGLADPLVATRYHSLVVDPALSRRELEVSAWAEDGTVMGLRHRTLPVEGVQFHPESILTDGGHRLLANWLARCGQPEALASGRRPPLTPRPRRRAPARGGCQVVVGDPAVVVGAGVVVVGAGGGRRRVLSDDHVDRRALVHGGVRSGGLVDDPAVLARVGGRLRC